MARKELDWSEEDLNKLHAFSNKQTSITEIAKALNRSPNSIRLTAKRYGIQLYLPGRVWEKNDKDFLKRHWGVVPLWYLSNKLHRTGSAIIEMAHKMRLEPIYYKSEDIGLMDFVRASGISRERILNTLTPKYDFPLIKRKNGKKQSYYYVNFEKILEWMRQNQNLYDASRIEEGFFVEPQWLKEKRRKDTDDNSYLPWNARRRSWTDQDIANLKQFAKYGYTPKQIAKKMGRSHQAVLEKMWSVKI